MFRRGTGLRRSLVVSTLGLIWGALLVASPPPSAADDYEPYLYDCQKDKDSVGSVSVTVAVPGPVYVDRPLVVKWKLGSFKLASPGDFPKGGHFLATATSKITGLWEENSRTYLTLPSLGRRDLSVIKADDQIEIPQDLSGQVTAPKGGTADIIPGDISVDFAPAERLINDSDPGGPSSNDPHVVRFGPSPGGGWTQEARGQDREPDDRAYGNDIHETKTRGATATVEFIGTGIEYFGERAKGVGAVDVSLETQAEPKPPVITDTVNASIYNGQPITGDTVYVKQSLWSKTNLPYGKHILTLKNASDNAMRVDAFKVYSSTVAADEPSPYRVVCSPASETVIRTLKVKVDRAPVSPSPTPTPTVTVTKTPIPGGTYTTTPPASTATPKPTLTVTATVTPTRPTPTAPQVFVTPTGGAHTGEAPDEGRPSGMGLISGGTAMLLGSVFGGVALKRRRAAHVRGRR